MKALYSWMEIFHYYYFIFVGAQGHWLPEGAARAGLRFEPKTLCMTSQDILLKTHCTDKRVMVNPADGRKLSEIRLMRY